MIVQFGILTDRNDQHVGVGRSRFQSFQIEHECLPCSVGRWVKGVPLSNVSGSISAAPDPVKREAMHQHILDENKNAAAGLNGHNRFPL